MNLQQYLVLEALASDIPPREIAEILNLETHDVEAVVKSLEERGLVRKSPGLFGERYKLTEQGEKALEEWRAKIRSELAKAEELFKRGREIEAQEIVEKRLPILPILLGLGVISLALWKLLTSRLPVAEE
ncbi:MarR family transcriptional regulator [Pyrobaculum aerophilum]|uniref:MarR family transcriptional regulator n=1 Tax=Pyrobaculum aerophilum TaxID=13773 RepID=A0A371QW89_9CREN|nr:helix-turn-helix domain-containing protein [Pyrobaculum aerophilum]RFA94463.1 MarR family transcriptional regulator [Pyrobaculum aerophilum]RFA95491.1 MarR family transcriptional regulator [Pyrobaculum aerophilum]